ncbi:glucosamine-6-phosphate deaminase [Microbacterium caowuchunii]|uniref:glucosamine-6-phosphate deaminase n=1 Tax=Microbacterium caowuchunii TaxID=2614638 RepID=UPI001248DD97|nr:glucosamine-6-phosphate deaminase [Microbacterium caowuchunii]QEW00879.1 glucosamine-6-phosphate deaminase [Microbacterium caowuchunii]
MAEILIVADRDAAGELAARVVWEYLDGVPEPVLGVATGSTPEPLYRELARTRGGRDLSRLRAFALDEYVGLPAGHPESYREVLRREIVEPLGLDPQHVHVPPADAASLPHAGERYEAEIAAAGGVGLQILGIGSDGHVGFNEPGSSLASRTRVKTLTEQTRRDNARFFDSIDDVPRHCVTQGLGTIRDARHLLLLAFGAQKAQAVAAALEGPLSASIPGSIVQLHPHVTVILDEDAASGLGHADYYRDVARFKPEWQGW